MSDDDHQEYDEELTTVLEAIWGEGFLSPGGTDEVDRILNGLSFAGKTILDIGCGLGGIDVHICRNHNLECLTGIDVDAYLVDRCRQLAEKYGYEKVLRFENVTPGPLPFPDASFDFVISKDSIIHIADKHTMAQDIYRVLKPGGMFAASDWLAGYEDEPTAEMQAYVDAEGLGFGLASASVYQDALVVAGFESIQVNDRNEWYAKVAREERHNLSNHLFEQLSPSVKSEFLNHQLDVWNLMIVALDQGQLRPTHLRATKPAN